MNRIQIVINISKKLYDRYKEKDHIKRCDIDEFEKALDNCIILPKGHGRLIDADRLKEVVHSNTVFDLYDEFVDMQPTVIDADRSEGE